ncbi:MAG: ABC transporter permease, partial [Vulcanimicrobiaceae bacterium]
RSVIAGATLARLGAYAGEALEALWRNRTRSILTMLGMIVGTAAVIAVLGLGQAAAGGIGATLGEIGDPGFFVVPDPRQNDPAAAAIAYRDTAAVAAADGGLLSDVYPNYQRTMRMHANGKDDEGLVTSTSAHVGDSFPLREGRRIDARDIANAAHVCLLSQPLETRFFGAGAYALGKTVYLEGVPFHVIGVYDASKGSIFNNVGGSEYLEIPYTTFHQFVPGPIDWLTVYARPGVTLAQVRRAVVGTLQRLHGPRARYRIQDALAFIGAFERTIGVVTAGVTAIGAVALVVAGIGITNIMLVSVAERTREIGIRKAIGGSRRDIALQFLMEAVVLSLLGGALGMLFGILGVLAGVGLISGLLGAAPIPWVTIALTAAGFSALVGIVFGTYPAIRAGALDPIEALRR